MKNIHSVMFPVLYAAEEGNITEDLANEFKNTVYGEIDMIDNVFVGGIVASGQFGCLQVVYVLRVLREVCMQVVYVLRVLREGMNWVFCCSEFLLICHCQTFHPPSILCMN